MTQLSPREIERRLTPPPAPPPPEGLLASLKQEIPEPAASSPTVRRPRRSTLLLAASLAVATLATAIVYRVAHQVELAEPARVRPAADLEVEQPTSLNTPAAPPPWSEADPAEPLPATAATGTPGTPSVTDASASRNAAPLRQIDREAERRQRQNAPGDAREEVITVTSESPLLPEKQAAAVADRLKRLESPGSVAAGEGSTPPDAATFVLGAPEAQRIAPPAPRLAELPVSAPAPSTGGTTEPNDQPYGDMFFRGYGVNPSIDTEDDRFSTFGLDVDTGSYTLVRRYLEDGHLPPREAVRVEEMINYFDYGDPAPREGDFALTAQAGPAPFADGPRYRLLRFGIRAREVAAADRKPATLIFVVDVSGSMNRENRLGLVRRSLHLLLDQLRADDRVGLVVYGSRGQVLLEPSGDLEAIRSAIDRLTASGATNAEEGLVLAYDLASRHLREGTLHRIVLCSDGVANVGRTGPESILRRIRAEAERGIELSTVGFGMGNYNDLLMEQLADRGDGNYAYVDDLSEARRIFVENLTGTLQTIARDAKVQVEFDPRAVTRYRLLGYENRDIADERFRDDTVDAGEIGAGHTVTALYEIKLAGELPRDARLATLRLRYQPAEGGEVVEMERPIRAGEIRDRWEAAPRELRLAAVVAELGEILKGSYWARQSDPQDLFVRAQRLAADYPGNLEVAELATLAGQVARSKAAAGSG